MASAAVKSACFPTLADAAEPVLASWLTQPESVVRPAFGADADAADLAGDDHAGDDAAANDASLGTPSEADLVREQAAAFERELAETRARAEAEGRVAGEAAGRAAFDEARSRLERAIDDLGGARAELAAELSGTVVEIALAVARAIVDRELDSDPDYALRLAREALALVADEGEIEVHVAPADLAHFEARRDSVDEAAPRSTLRIVADNTVDGGCIVVGKRGRVDARISARLRSVQSALGAVRGDA